MEFSEFEFFVVVLEPSSGKLKLPDNFAVSLEGREPREVKLCEAGDVHRSLLVVEVVFNGYGQMFLALGWEQFVHFYDLHIGHLLFFCFDGVDVLTIKVFDGTMCRRNYLYDNVSTDSLNFEFFVFVLEPSSDKLKLPEKFAESLEGRQPLEVKLREAGDVHCSLLIVEVVSKGHGQMLLGLGWEHFARSYDLQKGYLLLFGFDGVETLTVKVFDGTMCRRNYPYENISSDRSLDDLCVFVKGVELDAWQKVDLKVFCDKNKPKIPLYICKTVNSHIDHGKGQMYFNAEYTKNFLTSSLTTVPTDVEVYYNNNEKMTEVRMKIGEKNNAIMTGRWVSITKDQKWKVDDILVFCFQHDEKNKLSVVVKKL